MEYSVEIVRSCACGCGEPITALDRRTMYLMGHHERFVGPKWEVKDMGYETPCWVWRMALNRAGYGSLQDGDKRTNAHRVIYLHVIGEIPEQMVLDHLCRIRACVNPHHMEPVTNRENTLRGICAEVNRARNLSKTHCKYGHELSGNNIFIRKEGRRECRICMRIRDQKQKLKKKMGV